MPPKSGSDFRGEYLRRLPAVGKLLEHPELKHLSETCPRVLLVKAIQEIVDAHKARILSARDMEQVRDLDLSVDHIIKAVFALATEKARMSLRRAINATGDVLNDGLGRAPLNEAAQRAIQDVARGYSTLAVDGDRNDHVKELLSILTEAESALVLNNNAAAVMLILNTIADGKEVIISRGQLIDNDGFRLPEIIAKSGAGMVSVGATNKTHLRDYRDAISENTGAILKVHKSNYRIAGFSQDVPIQELAEIGRECDIPVIDNIGSGFLVDLTQHGFPEEPTAFLSIRKGADIVCFSGDKLLSGPQAGIVVGREGYLSAMRKNPLYRVLRADKLALAALEATLRSYLDTDRILELNPALRLLSRPIADIESMTQSLMNSLSEKISHLAVVEMVDKSPTKMLSIKPTAVSVADLDRRLRSRALPIVTLICEEEIIVDLRTVWEDEVSEISRALTECCQPCRDR